MKHLDITLTGKVQAVGLRFTVKQKANELCLNGYARNLKNGNVVIEIEGDDINIDNFISWIKSSPGHSEIKDAEIVEGEYKSYRDFKIF